MANEINTKIAGVSFDNRQLLISKLKPFDTLYLQREADNPYDQNAILVRDSTTRSGEVLGYIKKELAAQLAPAMDKDMKYEAEISAITGESKGLLGCNIIIRLLDKSESEVIDI